MTRNHQFGRGGAPKRLMARRRSAMPRAMVGITGLLVVPALLGAGAQADDFTGSRLTPRGLLAPVDAPPPVADPAPGPVAGLPPALATIEGIDLLVPAHDVVLIGYHEASYDDALGLTPVGRLAANENTTKYSAGIDAIGGADYLVLSSRGRRQGATTAVDIVLAPGVNVISPVSGIVTDVRPYQLYGRYRDTRIEIQPDGAPMLRVVLIHVSGVGIREGDRVMAGQTVLADEANLFPFSSQVDRYTEPARYAHVHLEVKPPGGAIVD